MQIQTAEPEHKVEAYLRDRVKAVGGRALKWVSPGNQGVPDRICIFPGGRVELVELKGKGGRLTPTQTAMFPRLEALGCRVWILWSRADVDDFMEGVTSNAIPAACVPGVLHPADPDGCRPGPVYRHGPGQDGDHPNRDQ